LLDSFAFLPNVRVDDVMVSFAVPGGSVGPHVDSYDVFLLQGQGERRWRFDTRKATETRLVEGIDLRILARFRGAADEVLGPGDVLYLPPGFAHHGVAATPCLTYSIGFRAPSAGEAWVAFAHAAASTPAAARLLEDPPLRPANNPGEIPRPLLARARAMVRSIDMSDDAIDRWFASFTTRLKPGHLLTPPGRAPDAKTILARLARGQAVVRSEDGRWAFLPDRRSDAGLLLYVGGVELEVPGPAAELARELCAARRHEGSSLRGLLTNRAARALLERLFAIGVLHFTR
jgi:50S ribosomal protein L16 3-hydroxylase